MTQLSSTPHSTEQQPLPPRTLIPGMMFLLCSILTKGVPSEEFWYSVSSYRICMEEQKGQ